MKKTLYLTLIIVLVLSMISVGFVYAKGKENGGVNGAIKTTDSEVSSENINHFEGKKDVYIHGNLYTPGEYYIRVTSPNEKTILGESKGAALIIGEGDSIVHYNIWDLVNYVEDGVEYQGYKDTSNNGGVYKVVLAKDGDFHNSAVKSDNFKVEKSAEDPVGPSTGDNGTETPSTGDNGTETPSTGDNGTETPSTGDNGTETPSTGDNETETPSTGDNGTETPSTGDNGTETPSTGDNGTETPSTGDNGTETPSTGDNGTETPSTGDNGTETPSTGDNGTETPSTGDNETETPSTGDNETEILNPVNPENPVDTEDPGSGEEVVVEEEEEVIPNNPGEAANETTNETTDGDEIVGQPNEENLDNSNTEEEVIGVEEEMVEEIPNMPDLPNTGGLVTSESAIGSMGALMMVLGFVLKKKINR